MRNKTFIILLILVPLLLVAGGVFYFFQSAQKGLENEPEKKTALPELLVSQAVISPILSFDNQKIWFMTSSGEMFRLHLESKTLEQYSLPQIMENPTKVIWQKDGGNFIIEQNIAGHSQFELYDDIAKQFTFYPQSLQKPQFIPASPAGGPGNKIVYDWVTESSSHELKISDANGQNFRKVADLHRGDYELAVSPSKNEVVLFTKVAENPSKLYLVNLDTGDFRELGEAGNYEGVKFSPDGLKILAARYISERPNDLPELRLFDLSVLSVQSIGIYATVEQTVWLPDSTGIIIGSLNGLVKYNLASFNQEEIYSFGPGENFVPVEILVLPQASAIFFVDELTRFLYQISLSR